MAIGLSSGSMYPNKKISDLQHTCNQNSIEKLLTQPTAKHRPVLIDYGLQIPIVRFTPKPRWNFKQAKWDEYAKDLDRIVK